MTSINADSADEIIEHLTVENLTVLGTQTVKQNETLQGDTTIGDEASDNLDINATLNTSFALGSNDLTNGGRLEGSTIRILNAGSGSDPDLTSNDSNQSLTLTGRLGIGQSTPLVDVHITNDQAVLTEVRLDNTNASGSMAYTIYDGSNKRSQFHYDTSAALLDIGTDISSGQVAISTNTDVEALRIDANQNVDIVTGALNMVGSNNIQDAGTDAIQFDGSANVTLPTGQLTLTNKGAGADVTLTVDNDDAVLRTEDSLVVGGTGDEFTVAGSSVKGRFVAHDTGTSPGFGAVFARHSDTATQGQEHLLIRSRGTEANPTAVQSGDLIAKRQWVGHDGTDFEVSASLDVEVANTVADGQVPGRLLFNVADSSGSLSEVIRFESPATISMDGGTTSIGSSELNLLDGMTGISGSDNTFISGTAGTDGNLAQWNTDGDLVDSGNSASDFATISGTPSDNQVATFTDGDTIKGETNLSFDGTTLNVTGNIALTDTSEIRLGDGNDYILRYDNTNTQLELESNDIDGGGTTGTLLRGEDGEDAVFITAATSLPADSSLESGEIAFALDETNDEVEYKAKYSDGTTVKTGTVALS